MVPQWPGAYGTWPQPNQTAMTCAADSRQPRSGGGGGRRAPGFSRQSRSRSTTSNTSRRISTPFFAVASSMVSAGWIRKLDE